MTAARVLTVASAPLGGDDPAGRLVARALLSEGVPVASRQVVDESESALEPALGAALETGGLVVVLASPGGSAGDIVRRVVSRLAGVRLALNEKLLAWLEKDFAAREQAMPHRLDRLALLPQGAELWATASGEPGWSLETRTAVVVVIPLGSTHLDALVTERLRPLARRRLGGAGGIALRTLLTTGLSPTDAEERLGSWLGKPGPVSVTAVISDGDVWVRLLARGTSHQSALDELAAMESAVRLALGPDCYGSDEDTLEAAWADNEGDDEGARYKQALANCMGQLTQRAQLALKLRYGDEAYTVDPGANVSIGRDKQNDIVVPSQHASRLHARVFGRDGNFIIADQSSNGTFVMVDGSTREIRLRREEAHLGERGTIGLGNPTAAAGDHLLHYRVQRRGGQR